MNWIALNLLFWVLVGFQFAPAQEIYDNGLIVELPDKVYIFAHGKWIVNYYTNESYHKIYHEGEWIMTEKIIERYNKTIVGVWCQANHGMKKYANGTLVPFPDNVIHNSRTSTTIPIITPYGVILGGM